VKIVFSAVLMFVAGVVLTSCGGGGGGGTSTNSSQFSQTYVASATAGEVLSYTFDSVNSTYSYTITKSAYGLEGATSSGTLTRNSDGSYSPSESPSSKIYAAQNGLLIGRIRMLLNGTYRDVPILGVSNPSVSGADMAGTYNYISLNCAAKNYGVYSGCTTNYGTVQVVSTGASTATYTTCTTANISNGTGSCAATTTGALTHIGGGIWEMVRTGAANKSHMAALKSSNNQRVGFLDFNDGGAGGYGYGLAVASEQTSPAISDVAGEYIAHTTAGTSGAFTIYSDSTTSHGLTITRDSPWTGIARTSSVGGQGYGILAGTGVYAYRNPQNGSGYFEIGMRK